MDDLLMVMEWPQRHSGKWWVLRTTSSGYTPIYEGQGKGATPAKRSAARKADCLAWVERQRDE